MRNSFTTSSADTLYSLPKYRRVASGILIGVSNSLCAGFKIVKEMGDSEDKSEIVKVKMWKKGNNFTVCAIYSPRTTSLTSHPFTLPAKP
jgi:hypothetical protein